MSGEAVGPPASAAAVKAELRRAALARREAIPADHRVTLSAAIFSRVLALPCFQHARTVLAYCSFGSEPVTTPFLHAVRDCGKELVLPRVVRATRSLALYRVREPARELRPGVWGIQEPDPTTCRPVALDALEFALVPGVAFDPRGGRLGYGAGYYDRLLGDLPDGLPLVAGAFEVQLVDAVPIEAHDRPVDRIATERRVIECASSRAEPPGCARPPRCSP